MTLMACGESDCFEACTEEFRSISVKIKTADGEPVTEIDYQVLLTQTGRAFTVPFNDDHSSGCYEIFSDAFRSAYENKELSITFRGELNGAEVVNEEYVVGADCCHVYLVSGLEEITL